MGSNANNGYVPNTRAQIGYLVQWFHEWSEMQRSDFLPILSQKFGNKSYVNGLLPGMEGISNLEDKPPSLFQCRIKLFREWADSWSREEKDQFLNHIKTTDPEFIRKYDEELDSSVKSSPHEDVNSNDVQVSVSYFLKEHYLWSKLPYLKGALVTVLRLFTYQWTG